VQFCKSSATAQTPPLVVFLTLSK